ncbi:MAG: glycosyltransferase, partial [Symploca sp. SIO2E6]|nr:glycosyltransferase [Symploca sp. SIO2E6]
MANNKFGKLQTVGSRLKRVVGLVGNGSLRYSHLLSRVKHLLAVVKARGLRYAIAKIFKKISQKLEVEAPVVVPLPETSQSDDINYQQWLNNNYPRQADLRQMAQTVAIFSYQPVISVIMPVFNPPEAFLREAIESVLAQVYPYWELCIADDASTNSYVRPLLEEYIRQEQRIKVVWREENGHISQASNSALELATGEFVALLDHDDLLSQDALYEIALLLNQHPHADMIYSDEDKIQDDGKFNSPFFKPDWCPDSFLSRMYTAHLG